MQKFPPVFLIRRFHGQVRGLDAVIPASSQFEGRFGRIFRALPHAIFTEDALKKLAAAMVAQQEDTPTPETEGDDEENAGPDRTKPAISAGYTYWGQFIDHDITFDPASSLEKTNDPDALVDFRTPRFDLDNVYGRGPDDQPYMYHNDGVRLLLGRKLKGNSKDPNSRDLQRNKANRALIGDPRNDENVIVSQLHATFIRFHNRVADLLKADHSRFGKVQRIVRWHYQWAVLFDFLKTIIGEEMLHAILPHLKSRNKSVHDTPPNLQFFTRPRNNSFMPVEFSVAAYRFGHSMVRPQYRLNEITPPEEGVPPGGKDGRIPIFVPDDLKVPSLLGFGALFPETWALDWSLFFKMGKAPAFGKRRIQPAYKIDTSLVHPLGELPTPVTGATPHRSLAERNLLRGLRMRLPSGQAVAQAVGEYIIPDDQLRVGKANEDDFKTNPTLKSISPEFEENAPLWYYILAEAQQAFKDNATPLRLGPVGGRIVGEVFVGLMWYDPHSFLRQHDCFTPRKDFQNAHGEFGIAELIAQALQAKDVGDGS